MKEVGEVCDSTQKAYKYLNSILGSLNSSPGWHSHVLLQTQSESPTSLSIALYTFDSYQSLRIMKSFPTERFRNLSMDGMCIHIHICVERGERTN